MNLIEEILENCVINAPEGASYDAPVGANYLSEFMTELPVNCLFHKGITGCGGTELALRNNRHTIIAMPFRNLVWDKAENKRHKGKVLGVDGDPLIDAIEQYINSHEVWKICVVYDSLSKVIRAFQGMGINPYEKCFLLVDEYHVLFTQYNFRNKAVRKLLEIAPDFEEKTYMSATPLCEEFMLKELRDLPTYEIVWPNKRKPTVILEPTSSPQKCTIELIQEKIDDESFGNLHFFINNVEFITNVLKETGIHPDKVKVVCADTPENKKGLGKYKIGKPSDAPCKINFYTSTCFEGVDIFDKKGRIYIISNGWDTNTLYDISTVFTQIIGRLRDSEYKNEVVHIVSFTQDVGEGSYEEYKELQEHVYNTSQRIVEIINPKEKNVRKEYLEKKRSGHFLGDRHIYVDGEFNYSMDENLLKKDLSDRKKREVYHTSSLLTKAYEENGFGFTVRRYKHYPDESKKNSQNWGNFKDAIERYHYLITTQNMEENTEELASLKHKFNYIENAHSKLRMNKIIELDYNTVLIKRELDDISDKPFDKEIKELIEKEIGYNNPIERREAKEVLAGAYKTFGVKKKATTMKLKKYFEVEEIPPMRRNGKNVRQIALSKKEEPILEKAVLEDL